MLETVLFVDDDPVLLSYSCDQFREKGMHIVTAVSGAEALKLFAEHEIAVMVTDNCMPEMSGMELLERVGQLSPDTVKIMMTSFTDISTLLTAINKGEVFRFIPKPWEPSVMLKGVKDAIRRYRLLRGSQRDEEFILYSLAETIELKDPLTKGHCDRVAEYALHIADALFLDEGIKREIRFGSWLHDCGKIGIPEHILNAPRALTEEEYAIVKKHPVWGVNIVRKSNLSGIVQDIILYHHERWDGKGYPLGLAGEDIPLEARVVAVADVFDALASVRPYRLAIPVSKARQMIADQSGTAFDPSIVDLFLKLINKMDFNSRVNVLK